MSLLGWFGLFLVGVVLYVVATYNALVRRRNEVRNAWSQIDVQLRRRHALIPNLVEAVKDAMDFEQETLTAVIEARSKAVAAEGRGGRAVAEAENALGAALGRLMAVVEQYPELKSNATVQRLVEELTSTENRIAFARQYLNDRILAYNNLVEGFPSNLVARATGFTPEAFLEIDAASRRIPTVDLRPG